MRTSARVPVRLPLAGSLLQYFGFQWDITWHVVIGRDSFWIPPHWLVYFGVALVLTSGLLPLWWGRGRAPIGSYLLTGSALVEIAAAPIDDLWHRLYGLDNTLWSPPHLTFILCGSVAPLALILLLRDRGPDDDFVGAHWLPKELLLRLRPRQLLWNPLLLLCGFALAWLDVALAEFRLHIPPPIFPWDFALFPPLMIAFALLIGVAGLVLTQLVGAVSLVCLNFTIIAVLVNLALMLAFAAPAGLLDPMSFGAGLLQTQTVPLLLPPAIAADLLLARLSRAHLLQRLVIAGLVFALVFYAVQFPYSWMVPPAWGARLLRQWLLALWLSPLAAILGLLLGQSLLRGSVVRATRSPLANLLEARHEALSADQSA